MSVTALRLRAIRLPLPDGALSHRDRKKTSRCRAAPGGASGQLALGSLTVRSMLRNELLVLFLEDIPLRSLRIVLGVDEAEPVGVVLARMVRLVVEARIPGLFAELDVAQVRLDRPDAVDDFPAAHQLVQVAGGNLLPV